jgi:anti-sigma factor ChrR (cupin superfamily)
LADKKTETIRGMIAQRLKAVAAAELSHLPAQPHLDEDVIAAFVEGRLGDSECQPVLAHLAACGACRRASAQMVQLENQVDSEPAGDVADEPGRLGLLLSKFGSMVSATGEEVVFAYQDSEEEEKKEQSPNMPATNDNQQ